MNRSIKNLSTRKSKFSELEAIPSIAVVIPAYCVENKIEGVIASLPIYIQHVIVVDDASLDNTSNIVLQHMNNNSRLMLIRHSHNQGVGGATISGFRKALELEAEIVVKIDGDGQMDPKYLPSLLLPIIMGKANYTKGNRFRDFVALRQMPTIRRLGNIELGFLTKLAKGYWNVFDPTNGYIAIQANMLKQLPLERVDNTYFFETSMLAELYLIGAYVLDIPMPARYGDQSSNLHIHQVLFEFPPRLLITLIRRITLKYFLYDFSVASIYLISGIPLFLFGLIFGLSEWLHYVSLGIPAPTGTVILPTICVILGIQLLLSVIQIDLQNSPSSPLSSSLTTDS